MIGLLIVRLDDVKYIFDNILKKKTFKTVIVLLGWFFLHFCFCKKNNNCSMDLYNGDIQTTIILFTGNVSSYKTNWILSNCVVCFVLPFISQDKQSDKCSWRRMNCLFVHPLFKIMMLFLYFCLFVDDVNKSVVFVFVAFVYHLILSDETRFPFL